MRISALCLCLAALVALSGPASAEPDIHDTRLLTQPAVSSRHVAFIYADDLWIADRDGKNVRRLTSDIGVESHPVFSPDGKTLAFSAEYEGNTDVYVLPVEGGQPKRLTWHPGPDIVRGFTPDGKAVLFSSPRHVFTARYTQLFTVPLTGGIPTQLPIPNAVQASFSPDGERIAYTPLADRSTQWKHYRGGTVSRILVYRKTNHQVEQIPQPEGRCNDTDPQWIGDLVYFRSDRDGEYNLFSFDTGTKKVKRLTNHKDFPILALGSGAGTLIYEQAGYLHLYDPEKTESQRLRIGVATDLVEARPRFAKGAKYIRNADISPSGARAVFEFRGEIVTVPAEKGDPRNLTNSPGVHDRSPVWSPDGKSIAWFADEGGEYKLHVRPADGKGPAKVCPLDGAGFYEYPVWSPDSKKLTFVDNSQTLFWIDLDKGAVKKIASAAQYGPPGGRRMIRGTWSADSAWIAYSRSNKAAYHTVFVYELATGKSKPITDGLSDAISPVFDRSGKYLYFLASTDAGPVNQWFAQSNNDMRLRRSIYLAVLKKGAPSPLARESDEENGRQDKPKEPKGDKPEPPPEPVVIDFDGIDQRILALPEPSAQYSNLQTGASGQLFYLEAAAEGPRRGEVEPGNTLRHFDLTKRKSETVLANMVTYHLSADGKKALVGSDPNAWSIIDIAKPEKDKAEKDKGKLKIDAIEVRVEPRAEWPQIFDEAWRINRDYFYDPDMHGANWKEIRKKYAVFLPHLATNGDLYRVIRWMLSELAVGHSNSGVGDRLHERKTVPGGLLGADYEIANGRYRFKKVYGGLNWTPELRAPLTVPGVEVRAGDYLLAVRGTDLKPPTNLYSLFENTAGKSIEITVASKPDGSDARTVTVEPLATEYDLRSRDWVEGNVRKVHQATGGRVAYVYVPNTARPGHSYFKRYFFPQVDKDAIIIDERFNGGGQVADYYIDHLRRPFTAMWATRYGEDIKTPGAAILGPKVMLIDETAGSGGDLLPWMFRKYKLGKLVGKRTWGGLVGILGFPVLMDGGGVTAPNLAIWTEDGFVVENEGVPPDVEVEQAPADILAGKDPQLDKAIEIVLKELKENPPARLQRPPFPVRVKKE
jgi:tricorn protease